MKVRLFDAHCDTAYELWQRGEHLARSTCHIDLEKAAELGAYAQIFAFCSCAGLPGVPCAETLLREPLAYLRAQVQQHAAHIAFAAAPCEVEALTAQGKIAALLSVEGPETIGCNPAALEALRQDGFVMTTLTWNADNALAGKHGSDRGLTAAGLGCRCQPPIRGGVLGLGQGHTQADFGQPFQLPRAARPHAQPD